MFALLFGRNAGWNTQQRDGYRVRWAKAAAEGLWPATLFGVAILIFLSVYSAFDIPWFLPLLGGLEALDSVRRLYFIAGSRRGRGTVAALRDPGRIRNAGQKSLHCFAAQIG